MTGASDGLTSRCVEHHRSRTALRFVFLDHARGHLVDGLKENSRSLNRASHASTQTCLEMPISGGGLSPSSSFVLSPSSIFKVIVRSSISHASSVLIEYSLNFSCSFFFDAAELGRTGFLQIRMDALPPTVSRRLLGQWWMLSTENGSTIGEMCRRYEKKTINLTFQVRSVLFSIGSVTCYWTLHNGRLEHDVSILKKEDISIRSLPTNREKQRDEGRKQIADELK